MLEILLVIHSIDKLKNIKIQYGNIFIIAIEVQRYIKTNVKHGPEACAEYFIDKSCSGSYDSSDPRKSFVGTWGPHTC